LNEGIFATPPARGEPICQKEDSSPYDIGLVFKNMISLSGQAKSRFLENVWKPNELFEFLSNNFVRKRNDNPEVFSCWTLIYQLE